MVLRMIQHCQSMRSRAIRTLFVLTLLAIGCNPGTPTADPIVSDVLFELLPEEQMLEVQKQVLIEELQDQQLIAEQRANDRAQLLEAVNVGDASRVSDLLNNSLGIDIASANDESLTAREIALRNGHPEIVDLLKVPEPILPIESVGPFYVRTASDCGLAVDYSIEAMPLAENWIAKLSQRMESLGYRPLPTRLTPSHSHGWFSCLNSKMRRMTHEWKAQWQAPDGSIAEIWLKYTEPISDISAQRNQSPAKAKRIDVHARLHRGMGTPIEE